MSNKSKIITISTPNESETWMREYFNDILYEDVVKVYTTLTPYGEQLRQDELAEQYYEENKEE